ncbi:MAG: SAM-dependent methyltransferase [Methylophaga sp.]|nr:SAM-dependent methyltransferase [Methylophaga sp.]
MMKANSKLPVPDLLAQQHSEQLEGLVVEKIQAAGGKINFADYMQACLYQPGLGYYSAGLNKFGAAGDFVTAPEISSLFSQAFARHIADVLTQTNGDCLEFGAGSGKMAGDILRQLAQLDCLPNHYFIIEASADLRLKQQLYLSKKLSGLFDKVVWLDKLPTSFTGAVVANEVCDAMPVHSLLFEVAGIYERYVAWDGQQLVWQNGPVSAPALAEKGQLITPLLPTRPFTCEVNLYAEAWLASLAAMLEQGAIFIIDYGHTANDYFHTSRAVGGIRCHYQHHVHNDPLILAGLQDLTAHVNFTDLAETAHQAGLNVAGLQNQSDFLLAGEILNLAQQQTLNDFQQLQQAAALKRLLLPEQMGAIFKALTLSKNLPPLPRCQQGDLRWQL